MGSPLALNYVSVICLISLLSLCEIVSARVPLSTHINDISEGKPVLGVNVGLYLLDTSGSSWKLIKQTYNIYTYNK